ncbi:hypothetical protein MLP_48690 [Microlunatus phosphovorus NM-1]|uniref:Uncharacterized protein n=1 Tax=Microlunatus phosphovorus (strain ATCC 700054 / DSM 10555 / JCM 9379 / NBRC 101784 / NCIMB 13414 / VKM Ac-1990 / NM-1) TaxID=1032480 RepID=F5XFE5_MICPN|nr:hypothetical protein MLP_48690 [Microlunatus phosphovorus NM-1]
MVPFIEALERVLGFGMQLPVRDGIPPAPESRPAQTKLLDVAIQRPVWAPDLDRDRSPHLNSNMDRHADDDLMVGSADPFQPPPYIWQRPRTPPCHPRSIPGQTATY